MSKQPAKSAQKNQSLEKPNQVQVQPNESSAYVVNADDIGVDGAHLQQLAQATTEVEDSANESTGDVNPNEGTQESKPSVGEQSGESAQTNSQNQQEAQTPPAQSQSPTPQGQVDSQPDDGQGESDTSLKKREDTEGDTQDSALEPGELLTPIEVDGFGTPGSVINLPNPFQVLSDAKSLGNLEGPSQALFDEFVPDRFAPPAPIDPCPVPAGAISVDQFEALFDEILEQQPDPGSEFLVQVNDIGELRDAVFIMNNISGIEDRTVDVTFNLAQGVFNFADEEFSDAEGNIDLDIGLDPFQDGTGDSLIIQGCSCELTTIDANQLGRHFELQSGDLTIQNLALVNGALPEFGTDVGGSILVGENGVLTVDKVIFDNNVSSLFGGAIANAGTIESITDSSFTNNFAAPLATPFSDPAFINDSTTQYIPNGGGAIANLSFTESQAFIGLIESTHFENNRAYSGGAILNNQNAFIDTISDSTFYQNSTFTFDPAVGFNTAIGDGGDGGAISFSYSGLENGAAPLTFNQISNSTFYGNTADQDGGAIALNNASGGDILNSIFESNTAVDSGGALSMEDSITGGDIEVSLQNIAGSDFIMNQAIIGNGGAINLLTNSKISEISDSLFYANQAGTVEGPGSSGGAISSFGQGFGEGGGISTIIRTDFDQNIASGDAEASGGAISLINGAAITSIEYSSFTDNQAISNNGFEGTRGGAIDITGNISTEASVIDIISHVEISGNKASSGGGISLLSTNASGSSPAAIIGSIKFSTIDSNSALGSVGTGGGVFVDGGRIGLFTQSNNTFFDGIDSTTISNNIAKTGGGISVANSNVQNSSLLTTVVLTNSTISSNFAEFNGGGINLTNADSASPVAIFIGQSTVTQNGSLLGNSGNGIYASGSSQAILQNSIVAENDFNDDLQSLDMDVIRYISLGNNLFGSIQGAEVDFLINFDPSDDDLSSEFDINPFPAGLDNALADNGGPTLTHALLDGSPAIDAVESSKTLFNVDQRGESRAIFGSSQDIGAFETQGNTFFFVPTDPDDGFFVPTDPDDDVIGPDIITDPVVPIDLVGPVVLDLDGDGIELIQASNSGITVEQDGEIYAMGWVKGDDALLVFDQNFDGQVSGLHEIALSEYHPLAKTDLEGLKYAFDSNQDHIFDHMDEYFAHFGVWQDINENGLEDEGEYQSLVEAGISSINLDAVENLELVEGNLQFAEGTFTLEAHEQGLFGDIGLALEAVNEIEGLENIEHEATFTLDVDPALLEQMPPPEQGFTLEDASLEAQVSHL